MTGLGTRSIGKSLRLFDPRGVAVDSCEMVEFCRIAVSCIWHIGIRDPTKATFASPAPGIFRIHFKRRWDGA